MTTTQYIKFPIETNPGTLAVDVYNYIKARKPLWQQNDGNLDTWIIQAISTLAAELRDLASDVPDDIFRWFGATMMAIPPIDETSSTVNSTWTMIDNLGYTVDAGTQVVIRDAAGNFIPFEVVSTFVVNPGTVATAAGAVQLRSIEPGAFTAGLGGVGVAAQLQDTLAYVSTIVLTGITTGGVDAEEDTAYLNRLALNLRLLSRRPILPPDFSIMARNIAGVYRAVTIDGYNPFHNLLSANDASFETSVAGYTATNAALVQSATFAADGVQSARLTAASAADMSAELVIGNTVATVPGETITGIASFRAGTTGRNVKVGLHWFDVANASLGIVYGANVADTNAGFTQASVTAVAPAAAAKVAVIVFVTAPANAEIHYVDKVSIRRGAGVDWVAGGTAETGNARTVTVAAIDTLGADVSGTIQTAIQALLAANREVTFQVYVVGAKRTAVDVTFAAKAAPGYIAADVQAAGIAAVQAYLNQAVWGAPPGDPQGWTEQKVVRYSEIAQVVSNTEGLDYWTSLTIGYAGSTQAALDINISGPAALATAGAVVGVVT